MLHQLRFFGFGRYSSLLRNAARLLKSVPGSDKDKDSKMSQLTDGSLVVVVILDVQVATEDRERRVILVEAGNSSPVV